MSAVIRHYQKAFIILNILIVTVLIIWNQQVDAAPPMNSPVEGLFTEAEIQGRSASQPVNSGLLIIQRHRDVTINFDFLRNLERKAGDSQQLHVAHVLPLNLFDDVFLSANITHIKPSASGNGWVWSGTIADLPHSTVSIVVTDGFMTGDIRLSGSIINGKIYQIRPHVDGHHIIKQIVMKAASLDQVDFAIPPNTPETLQHDARVLGSPEGSPTLIEDGSIIDVMVAYTPQSRDYVGGTMAMLNEIDQAIALTNQSFVNSGIAAELRLVHTVEVDYTSSGNFSTDNQRFTQKTDGYMDEIHALRNTYAADLVSLIVKADTTAAGRAWLLQSLNPKRSEAYGFSVVDICCASAGLVFAHEIGHNLGAAHDWHAANAHSIFSHGYGFTDRNCRWKTLMAYGSECEWVSTIPYFSNPNIQYNGQSLGVHEGTKNPCPPIQKFPDCDADNHKLVNETAIVVANYRVNQSYLSPKLNMDLRPLASFVEAHASSFDYELILENLGGVAATDIQIVDTIPEETAFVSASHKGNYVDGAIIWSDLTLSPNESLTLTFQLRPHADTLQGVPQIADKLINTVSVTSAEGASIPETAYVTVIVKQKMFFPLMFR